MRDFHCHCWHDTRLSHLHNCNVCTQEWRELRNEAFLLMSAEIHTSVPRNSGCCESTTILGQADVIRFNWLDFAFRLLLCSLVFVIVFVNLAMLRAYFMNRCSHVALALWEMLITLYKQVMNIYCRCPLSKIVAGIKLQLTITKLSHVTS